MDSDSDKTLDHKTQASLPPVDENGHTVIETNVTRQSGIDRAALTISRYMAEHGLEGQGVNLSSTGSSASDILTAEDGRKYDMGQVVAEGGMGAIIDAKDRNLRRSIAMKVLLNPQQVSKTQLLRFIEEAQVTANSSIPGSYRLMNSGWTHPATRSIR